MEFHVESCEHSGGAFNSLILAAYQIMMSYQCALDDPNMWPEDRSDELKRRHHFDFIIIGGGTAGSVLASRLTEISSWSVLLVEAGHNPPVDTQIPALWPTLMHSRIDWKYSTEPEKKACQGSLKQSCRYSTGRVLGGTSSIDQMQYIRGNKVDFDDWESAGNNGWGYDSVLPYFKKSENFESSELTEEELSKYHGTGGYLNVARFNYLNFMHDNLMAIAPQFGVRVNDDINGRSQMGFTRLFATVKDGIRQSAAKAFLQPAKNRRNLYVIKDSIVTKIIFDGNPKRAVGIMIRPKRPDGPRESPEHILLKQGGGKEPDNTFLGGEDKGDKDEDKDKDKDKHEDKDEDRDGDRDEDRMIIRARKEVLLSAGTFNSAKILMESGIGPKSHLKKAKVKLVEDLAVGENLQDHLSVLIPFSWPRNLVESPDDILLPLVDYIKDRKGILTGGKDTAAFVGNTKKASKPEIELEAMYIDTTKVEGSWYSKLGFKEEIMKGFEEFLLEKNMLLVQVTLLKPKSRGKVTLNLDDIKKEPIIHANYLENEDDTAILLKAIEEVVKADTSSIFKRYNIKVDKIAYEPCDTFAFKSTNYWKCIIQHMSVSSSHPVGTTKMGPSSDSKAVVDCRLRIYGIRNLRVVGGSVIPTITRGGFTIPNIMIAEKASDMIKEDWRFNMFQLRKCA